MLKRLSRHPYFPHLALTLLGLASFILYVVAFVRPYFILSYIVTSKLDFPSISGRQPGAASAFLGAFLGLFLLYALAYRVSRHTTARGMAGLVFLWSLALAATLMLAHPIGANDIFGYTMHGELMVRFRANPLLFPATNFPEATFAAYSGYAHQASNYGPLWTWIEAAVVAITGTSNVLWAVLGFKLIATIAYLTSAATIYVILRRRSPDQSVTGLLFFAWNPLILFEYVVNGHNDALFMALVVAGVLMWELDRPLPMVVALTLSLLIKVPSALLLPIFFLSVIRRTASRSDRWFLVSAGIMTILVLVGVTYLSLPQGAHALDNLLERADLFAQSLPALIRQLLRPLVGIDIASATVRAGALLALGVAFALQLGRSWLQPHCAPRFAFGLWLFLLLFTTLWFQPWYATWLVPLAALYPPPNCPTSDAEVRGTQFLAGLFSLTVTWGYIVGGYVWVWIPALVRWNQGLGLLTLSVVTIFGLPWILFFRRHQTARQRIASVVNFLKSRRRYA
jgi:hypothetical protein